MSGRRRLVAVHHRLNGFTGHRFQEGLGLVREAPRRGFEPVLLISAIASPAVRAALPEARAVLHDPALGPGTFDERTRAFVDMLHRHVDAHVGARDVVLMTVATQCEVRAFATWLRGLPAAQRPRVVFLFQSDRWNRFGPIDRARQMAEMRVLASELAGLDPSVARRLVFGTLTAGVARELSTLLGVQVTESPCTHTYAAILRPGPGDRPNEPPVVGFLSGGRPERGSHLVADIVAACRAKARVRFLVHLVNEQVASDAWQRVEKMAAAPDVEAVLGELDPDAYGAMLARCDVVALPYDRTAYRQRQSAVLADAVVAGKAVVVPSGTWPGERVADGTAAGVAFAGGVEGIAGAVAECVRRLPELRARARELSPGWAARQSLSGFLDWMEARLAEHEVVS